MTRISKQARTLAIPPFPVNRISREQGGKHEGLEEDTARQDVAPLAGDEEIGCEERIVGRSDGAVQRDRPSTAPTHTDGKVAMKYLGRDNDDVSSAIFDPAFSRLRTRRVILDR